MANLVLGRLKRRQCFFPILLRGLASMAISEVSGYARYTEHLVERDFHDLQSKTVPVFLGQSEHMKQAIDASLGAQCPRRRN